MDARRREAPAAQMSPRSQPADYAGDTRAQGYQRLVVEMVPVVVGNEEDVDIRDFVWRDDVASCKGSCAQGDRASASGEHGVYEYAFAAELDEKGGVPQPDDAVLVRRQAA